MLPTTRTSVLKADLVFRVGNSPTEDITYFANVYGDDVPVHILDTYEMGGTWYAAVEAYFGEPFVSHAGRYTPARRTAHATIPFSQIEYAKTDPLEIASYQAALWAAEASGQMDSFLAGVGLAMNEPTNFLHEYYNIPIDEPATEAEAMADELAREAETFSVDVEHLNDLLYGTADLGTHFTISGGEVMELGEHKTDDEIPF